MILRDVTSCCLVVSAMKIELAGSYDKLVPNCKGTRRHIPGTAIFIIMIYIVVVLPLKQRQYCVIGLLLWAGIAQSIQRLAGGSGDRIPVGARFSSPVQTSSGAHPASYTMGTGSFPGLKRPGRGVDHPPHLAPRRKKG